MQGRLRQAEGFSTLCLDSDKGIFKFLELTSEASQFYFHRGSIISFSGLAHTSAGVDSDGAGTQLGVGAGG